MDAIEEVDFKPIIKSVSLLSGSLVDKEKVEDYIAMGLKDSDIMPGMWSKNTFLFYLLRHQGTDLLTKILNALVDFEIIVKEGEEHYRIN